MSKPARIVIAVVVLGLAAAGIAYRTAHRPQDPSDSAEVCLAEDLGAQPEKSKAAEASSSDLTSENSEGVCGPDVEVCDLPKAEKESQPASPKVESGSGVAQSEKTEAPQKAENEAATQDRKLPKLIDLGRGTCIPCKKMLPILKELQTEYKGRAEVEIIDLREQPDAASVYNLRLIPTQIFYDSDGEEVWRHEGFLAKEEIVKKLKELGAD